MRAKIIMITLIGVILGSFAIIVHTRESWPLIPAGLAAILLFAGA